MNNDINNKRKYYCNMDNIVGISIHELNFLKQENYRLVREINETLSKLSTVKRSKLRLKNFLNEKIQHQKEELELKDKEIEKKNNDIKNLSIDHYKEINKVTKECEESLEGYSNHDWSWDNIEKEDLNNIN